MPAQHTMSAWMLALGAGVKVLACPNTRRGHKLVADDMPAKVGYLSSGEVELMRRQQEGWSYIRP